MSLSVRFALLAMSATMVSCNVSSPTAEVTGKQCIQRPNSLAGILGGDIVQDIDPLAKKVVMLLMETPEGSSVCTGSPISDRIILTAAHCVNDATKVRVAFKTNAFCDTGFTIEKSTVLAEKFLVHEGYREDVMAANDLALVKLSQPLPFDYQISRLYNDDDLANTSAIMTGYGKTSEAESSLVQLRTVKKQLGQSAFLSRQDNSKLYFDQTDARGICNGDSGGPVFFETDKGLALAGVNSTVSGKTLETVCRGSGVAMFVPAFTQWIHDTMEKLR